MDVSFTKKDYKSAEASAKEALCDLDLTIRPFTGASWPDAYVSYYGASFSASDDIRKLYK